MSDGLQIPEHLWKALELMEQEMGVPKNNLVCQAIFTLARLNGYVLAGQTPLPFAAAELASSTISGHEEVLEPPAPPARERARETPSKSREAPPREAPPPLSHEEAFEAPSEPPQDTSPRHVAPPPPREKRRSNPVAPPPSVPPYVVPPPPPLPPYLEEEVAPPPEEVHLQETEAPEEDDSGAYDEAELAPPMLYIEIPGEEAVLMEGDEFVFGRGKTCNFVIDSNRVSRQHARVLREGDGFVLEDLNSSNGTFYGKQREKVSRRKIADGDEFIFGTERVTFYIQ